MIEVYSMYCSSRQVARRFCILCILDQAWLANNLLTCTRPVSLFYFSFPLCVVDLVLRVNFLWRLFLASYYVCHTLLPVEAICTVVVPHLETPRMDSAYTPFRQRNGRRSIEIRGVVLVITSSSSQSKLISNFLQPAAKRMAPAASIATQRP